MSDSRKIAEESFQARRARKSIFYTAAFRALAQVGTLLGYIVMVRGMSEHDFGILSLLYSIVPVIGSVLSLGLEQTLKRFQPEYLRLGKRDAAQWLVGRVGKLRVGANLTGIAVLLAAWSFIAPVFHLDPYRSEFLLFIAIILLHFQAGILTLSLSAHMLHQYSVGMGALLAAIKLIAYLVIAKATDFTLRNVILADTVAYAFFFGGLLLAHWRCCRVQITGYRPSVMEKKRLIRYGAYSNFNDAAVLMTSSSANNFFVAALMTPLAVGAYSFSVRLDQMAGRLVPNTVFESVIQPVLFSMPKDQAHSRLPRYFSFLINTTLLFRFPLAAGMIVYHRDLVITLFDGKFLDYSPLLPVVFFFALLNGIGYPASLIAQYTERAWVLLLSKISIIFGVAAMLFLIPLMGVYGAAVAAGITQVIKNGIIWWNVREFALWGNALSSLSTSFIVWGGFMAICHLVKTSVGASPVVNLVIGSLVGSVTFLAYLRTPALSKSDRSVLATLFHGREARILRALGLVRG